MKIIIIGAGKVGSQIAQTLSAENHDVTIIDKREDIRQELDNNLDIMTVIGNGANVRISNLNLQLQILLSARYHFQG